MLSTDGILGFYAGLGPILFKQIPYTMAKFAVQGKAAELMYNVVGQPDTISKTTNLGVALGSGVIAGVTAAIISHPADTLLSKVNKAGAGGTGSTASRLMNIAKELGFVRLCTTGLGARCVMIGTLTAGQFAIFDTVMGALGAKKFHFHPPGEEHH
jgi:solute carrier family 25 phosphate transporter 3